MVEKFEIVKIEQKFMPFKTKVGVVSISEIEPKGTATCRTINHSRF